MIPGARGLAQRHRRARRRRPASGIRSLTVNVFGADSCRGSSTTCPGARLSEHAFGNAVDVAGSTLADGRRDGLRSTIWKTTEQPGSRLPAGGRRGRASVSPRRSEGPGADAFHYNDIHLDLANHGSTDTGPRRICEPTPAPNLLPAPGRRDGLPPAPDIDEPLDIAHLSAPAAAAPPPADAGRERRTRRGLAAGCRLARRIPCRRSLPAGVYPTVDTQPTSSIRDHDN